MMSAEWLASGTDLVKVSAKGVEDTSRQQQKKEEEAKTMLRKQRTSQ